MNPAQLLNHFDRISDAPDAIHRLRRFILDLAVRGKLVEQDLRDEPASELLMRVQNSTAQRINKKHTPEVDGADYPLELPTGWELVPLIALGKWAIGSGFPKNEQGSQSGPFFFLKVSDMNLPGNERSITTSQNFIDQQAAIRIGARIHPAGTIIFPKIGGAIATNKRRILTRESAIDNNCLGIIFWPELLLDWCYLLLTALDFTKYQAGTAVPALQQGVLEQIPIGLPPIAEQHRIVAKVNELMALCDRLETAQAERESRRDRLVGSSLHRLNDSADADAFHGHARFYFNHLPRLTTQTEHIQQLRQTILNLAVRGKLVPQDPNDEPAAELLKQVAKQKATVGNSRTGRDWVGEIDKPVEEAFVAPLGWAWTRIGSTVERVTVGYVGPMKDQYAEYGIPFLRSQNVRANRFREEGLINISAKFHKAIAKSALAPGDVVVVRSGNVGTACVIPPSLPEANCSDLVVVKTPIAVLPTYLCFYLNSIATIHIEAGTVGVALTHFNTKSVATMPLPLPPLAEQQRIVAKVDELMALCDKLDAQLTTIHTDSRRLLNAVLHEALEQTA